MKSMRISVQALLLLVLTSLPVLAHADNITPMVVEIREIQPGVFSTTMQFPPALPDSYRPTITLPEGCIPAADPGRAPGGSLWYRCTDGLRGGTVSLDYRGPVPPVLTAVRVHLHTGEELSTMLPPGESVWHIPPAETWLGVVKDYTVLGVMHILLGFDHLLFVLCLLWIAGSLRRVLLTITGFTLAHSVTLILSALQVIEVPRPPVEAAISLSILFLACEVARGKRDTVSWRYPIVVSSLFGLLHGFGFAAALTEIGLPRTELVTGLLFFNVGVELGQIAFIAAVLAGQRLLQSLRFEWPQLVTRLPIYAVGVLSAFWTIRGVAAMFQSY
jgi:hydrogenase/urease accessory protein HupE